MLTIGQAETIEFFLDEYGLDVDIPLKQHSKGTNYDNGLSLAIRTLKLKNLIKLKKDGEVIVLLPSAIDALNQWQANWEKENGNKQYPWEKNDE